MITAIIVDDEKSGRETLNIILRDHFAGKVQVLGMGGSVNEGIGLIEKYNPQVVFLDMEMPSGNGLEIVNKIDPVTFEIIVTTAHKQYGIDAVKARAFDYLLKPIDVDELEAALNKVEIEINNKTKDQVLKQIIDKAVVLNSPKHKIPLLIGSNKTVFVETNTIIRCEASGNYTRIWFTTGKSELITKLIKDVEDLLSGCNFFRVHKSHLINIDHVKSYMKSEDTITMSDDSIVPLSRNIKGDFLKMMNI